MEQSFSGLQEDFEGLQRSHADLETIISAMQSDDDGQAKSIFRMLRRGDSPQSIVRHIDTGDALIELRLSTETRYRFDFPYKKRMPCKILASSSTYVRSLIYEAVDVFNTVAPAAQSTSKQALWDQYKPQYLKPYQAAVIMDSRLDSLHPSKWTSVSQDDGLMRRLLHLYFLHEYPWYSFFHLDHFLDDMASLSDGYCSSLLVNVVLTLACGCNSRLGDRAEYWNPNSLAYKFFAEAKRLWELEMFRRPQLTTVQSAALINIVYNMQSMDKLGVTYTLKALSMALELGIFDDASPALPEKTRVSFMFTSWSLFNWTSLQQYHFMRPPTLAEQPKALLPDALLNTAWYPEITLQYPSSQQVVPLNFGTFFKAKSDLAVILHHITTSLWGDNKIADQNIPDFINSTSSKLDTWLKSLPETLSPIQIVFPAQLKLHLLYNNVLINLHNLIVARATSLPADTRLKFSQSALSRAEIDFEVLVRLYFLRHGYEFSDTYLTHHLATLAFTALGRLNSTVAHAISSNELDDIRSTVFLAAKGLADQGENYYVPYTICELIKSQLRAGDAATLLSLLGTNPMGDESSRLRTKHVQAEYPVNIVDITDHPAQQRLGNMMQVFSDLAVEAQSQEDGSRSGTS